MGDIIRRPNVTNRRLPCRLTEKEKDGKLREVAASIGTIDALRRQVTKIKAAMDLKKKELVGEEGRRDAVAARLT